MSGVDVQVRMSTKALTLRTRDRGQGISTAILGAERMSADAMVKRARAMSQGFLRTRDLRRLGHPYRIGGDPPLDPAIINTQTGNLQWRWQARVTIQKDGTQITLWNTARYAKYMLGTRKMMRRPILDTVFRVEQGARLARLEAARLSLFNKK